MKQLQRLQHILKALFPGSSTPLLVALVFITLV